MFAENLYRIQELAETQAVSEEMVTKDAFLSELFEKGTDVLKKTALKTALKQVLKRIVQKGLGGAVGVIIDLGAADDIARDPNEVFRDEDASDSEVNRAIASTLATKRNDRNSAQLDMSLLLILRRLGCEVETR